MSIFGQVWIFSAASFVLGAFLAWLFLVRPTQRRNRELQRRLSAAEASRPATAEANQGPRTMSAGAGKSGSDEEGSVVPAQSTRRFAPAEAQPEAEPTELTQHIAPAPSWPEQDSLAARRPAQSTGRGAGSDRSGEFTEFGGEEPRPDHSSVPDPDSPTRFVPRRGDELGSGGDPAGQGAESARRGASLFEPVEFADVGPLDDTGTEQGDRTTETPPAYAFGGGPGSDSAEEHPPVERTQVLPKRRPGQSPLESFEQPKPAQSSARPGTRREPEGHAGGRSGSLFEPTVAAPGSPAPARDDSGPGDLPTGPFGPGSAMPRPGGGRPSDDYTVKASVTALRYCPEGSPEFSKMVAEVWFRTPADAERVGFRPLSS